MGLNRFSLFGNSFGINRNFTPIFKNINSIVIPNMILINDPVAATVQRDAVLRVGQQAAQLAGRGDAWDQQRDAAQGGDSQDDMPARQRGKSIPKFVTTKAICYINNPPFLLIYLTRKMVNKEKWGVIHCK